MGIKYSATYNGVTRDVTDASGSSFVLKYGGKDSGGNDHVIQQETISAGGGNTLSCAGKLMLGDIKVGSIKTISCGGKKAASNIVVSSQSYTPNVTITSTGSGSSNKCGFTINGTTYYGAGTYTVALGTTISVFSKGGLFADGDIWHNGSVIIKGKDNKANFSATGNMTIEMIYNTWNGSIRVTGGTRT